MKTLTKALLLAALPLATAAALPSLAYAQAATEVGVANLEEAVGKSNAWILAANQIRTTYKAQIDAVEARSKVLSAELQPMITAFQAAQRAPNPNQAALQQQAVAIQTKQQAAQKELAAMSINFDRATAYSQEQIAAKLDGALKAAMVAKKIGIVLQPQAAISYQPARDITGDIVAQLNATVPTVNITPPANWQPGGQGQAQGAAPVAPRPATPAPKPATQGR
jgi:Skp family chaperone for outer membrane proteins